MVALTVALIYSHRPTERFQLVIDGKGTKYVIDKTNGQIMQKGDHTEGQWVEYLSSGIPIEPIQAGSR